MFGRILTTACRPLGASFSMTHSAATTHSAHHGSIWPLVVTAGVVILLAGIIVPWMALVGLAVLIAAIVGWIREDVAELAISPRAEGRSDYWYAAVFLITSEIVLFGVLFTYYFWVRGYSLLWPPPEIPEADLLLVSVNTVILLASGWTAHSAESALKRGDARRFERLLGVTLFLGVIFLLGQAYEYVTAGFLPTTGTYGTAFFALTGVHGLHVFAGLVVLAILLVLSRRGFLTRERASGAGGAILYWHFVDVVWVVLYVVLYLRWI